ncbi:heme biosynthesis HemY N-terminal domain-containing protein [Nitrincola sp.]|uniref:heme biosynthesis HemY N-terminal domain-containing protein n=1 Tax=Nitrincola sp. TaxID=1926584 RepID=UPI003A917351
MKRLFVLLLLALVVGAWAGQMMVTDSGYVLLAYNNTTVETTLWVFLVGVFIAFILLHLIFNLIFNARLPTGQFRQWRAIKKHQSARKKTLKGLLALSEGEWHKAQVTLTRSAEDFDLPVINYIAAARAAHENGDQTGADELLKKALKSTPEASLAVSITQSQIQVARGQLEAALANLLKLRRKQPHNKQILALLADVSARLNDWQGVADILPDLRRSKALPLENLNRLERETLLHLLQKQRTPTAGGFMPEPEQRVRQLQSIWVSMPETASNYDEVVTEYADQLIAAGGHKAAEALLRLRLEARWSEILIPLYGLIDSPKPRKLYQQAQKWLEVHEQSPGLYIALARLAAKCQLWSEAVGYYEQSLSIDPNLDSCAEFARLLQQLEQPERAMQVMNQGISHVTDKLPDLPLPQPALKAD